MIPLPLLTPPPRRMPRKRALVINRSLNLVILSVICCYCYLFFINLLSVICYQGCCWLHPGVGGYSRPATLASTHVRNVPNPTKPRQGWKTTLSRSTPLNPFPMCQSHFPSPNPRMATLVTFVGKPTHIKPVTKNTWTNIDVLYDLFRNPNDNKH